MRHKRREYIVNRTACRGTCEEAHSQLVDTHNIRCASTSRGGPPFEGLLWCHQQTAVISQRAGWRFSETLLRDRCSSHDWMLRRVTLLIDDGQTYALQETTEICCRPKTWTKSVWSKSARAAEIEGLAEGINCSRSVCQHRGSCLLMAMLLP